MCRNIKPLFNFEPPTTKQEIHEAALQFVRKVSGFREPSQINQVVFDAAVAQIASNTAKLLSALTTDATPHNREVEAAKAHARAIKRFGL